MEKITFHLVISCPSYLRYFHHRLTKNPTTRRLRSRFRQFRKDTDIHWSCTFIADPSVIIRCRNCSLTPDATRTYESDPFHILMIWINDLDWCIIHRTPVTKIFVLQSLHYLRRLGIFVLDHVFVVCITIFFCYFFAFVKWCNIVSQWTDRKTHQLFFISSLVEYLHFNKHWIIYSGTSLLSSMSRNKSFQYIPRIA